MQILFDAMADGDVAHSDDDVISEASSPVKHVNTPEWPSETRKRRRIGKISIVLGPSPAGRPSDHALNFPLCSSPSATRFYRRTRPRMWC